MSAGFCTLCSLQVESFEGMMCCPRCGTTGVPCLAENQVDVSINLQELRVLCMWAENWALTHCQPTEEDPQDYSQVVYAIATRLRRQLPEGSPPLTFADEFKKLREAGYDIETNHPAGEEP